jgi:hypothetical protein
MREKVARKYCSFMFAISKRRHTLPCFKEWISMDKQKPEVSDNFLLHKGRICIFDCALYWSQKLQAAAMISLGVATAIQIVSNLENTTTKKNSALLQLFEKMEEEDEESSEEDEVGRGNMARDSLSSCIEHPNAEDNVPAPAMAGDHMAGGRGRGSARGRGRGGVGVGRGWGMPGGRMGREGPGRGVAGRGVHQQGDSSLVLPPAVMAQFDGMLPSEKLTINCIMQVRQKPVQTVMRCLIICLLCLLQDVVNMWAADTTILAEVQERSSNTLASSLSPKKRPPRTLKT